MARRPVINAFQRRLAAVGNFRRPGTPLSSRSFSAPEQGRRLQPSIRIPDALGGGDLFAGDQRGVARLRQDPNALPQDAAPISRGGARGRGGTEGLGIGAVAGGVLKPGGSEFTGKTPGSFESTSAKGQVQGSFTDQKFIDPANMSGPQQEFAQGLFKKFSAKVNDLMKNRDFQNFDEFNDFFTDALNRTPGGRFIGQQVRDNLFEPILSRNFPALKAERDLRRQEFALQRKDQTKQARLDEIDEDQPTVVIDGQIVPNPKFEAKQKRLDREANQAKAADTAEQNRVKRERDTTLFEQNQEKIRRDRSAAKTTAAAKVEADHAKAVDELAILRSKEKSGTTDQNAATKAEADVKERRLKSNLQNELGSTQTELDATITEVKALQRRSSFDDVIAPDEIAKVQERGQQLLEKRDRARAKLLDILQPKLDALGSVPKDGIGKGSFLRFQRRQEGIINEIADALGGDSIPMVKDGRKLFVPRSQVVEVYRRGGRFR